MNWKEKKKRKSVYLKIKFQKRSKLKQNNPKRYKIFDRKQKYELNKTERIKLIKMK